VSPGKNKNSYLYNEYCLHFHSQALLFLDYLIRKMKAMFTGFHYRGLITQVIHRAIELSLPTTEIQIGISPLLQLMGLFFLPDGRCSISLRLNNEYAKYSLTDL